MRDNLEALANHVHSSGMLKTVWIERLVPWECFLRPPNGGHQAMADLLIVGAAEAVLSGNYDSLIEDCGKGYGFDFRAALDGDEALAVSGKQKPLLKFHGCSQIGRASTIWTPSQLNDQDVIQRLQNIKTWMASNLRNKDLLIVGFWSDWHYLNDVLQEVLANVSPVSVTVIDPLEPEELEVKAPGLWSIANGSDVKFRHLQASGADALAELRKAFSTSYMSKAIAAGQQAMEQEIGGEVDPSWLEIDDLSNEALHQWRRDAEGKPNRAAPTKLGPENTELFGYFHLILRRAGAQRVVGCYELNGKTIRVVNGAGSILSSMKERFAKPPVAAQEDIVVAAGAQDVAVPSNIVREEIPGNVVRASSSARWLDFDPGKERASNMNDIATWAELVLRDAGFDTWTSESPPATVFENPAVMGFLHVFDSSKNLLAGWEERQQLVLRRYAPKLRSAGEKSWNVYSIFVTADHVPELASTIDAIEEDFSLTRKIARSGVKTKADAETALLPLTGIRAQPLLEETDLRARLRLRLEETPASATSAFLAECSACRCGSDTRRA